MTELPMVTWWRFFLWLAAGLILYFLYGIRKSRLNRNPSQ
jgi:APA family basic amino acid/polyamine antiporter